MGALEGKKGLVLGVANENSIAWGIAKQAMEDGALCGFTHLPDRPDDERQRNRRRVSQLTDKAENAKFLMPLDVSNAEQIATVLTRCKEEFGKLDFIVHSVAFAQMDDLKKDTVDTSRDGFLMAMDISVFSLMSICSAAKDILADGASVLAMTYYGGEKVVVTYNVMGVCKAALDAAVKYISYDLGKQNIRVNAISAGPLRTLAGRAAGVDDMLVLYEQVSPMGRNITHEEVAHTASFLLSDKASGITGEIVHVDCGFNVMGTPGRIAEKLRRRA